MEYISADEIAGELAPSALQEVRLQAGRLFFQRISDRIERQASFLAETTLAGKGFQRFVQRLSQANYTVILVFVCLDSPELCLARVRQRVRKGGHAIPAAMFCGASNAAWRTSGTSIDLLSRAGISSRTRERASRR